MDAELNSELHILPCAAAEALTAQLCELNASELDQVGGGYYGENPMEQGPG